MVSRSYFRGKDLAPYFNNSVCFVQSQGFIIHYLLSIVYGYYENELASNDCATRIQALEDTMKSVKDTIDSFARNMTHGVPFGNVPTEMHDDKGLGQILEEYEE